MKIQNNISNIQSAAYPQIDPRSGLGIAMLYSEGII